MKISLRCGTSSLPDASAVVSCMVDATATEIDLTREMSASLAV